MKCYLTAALPLLVAPLHAQTIVDNGIDDRVEALNAVFAFRSDLGRDSTVIARCGIPTARPDSGVVAGLEPRFQALLVRPDPVQARAERGCGVVGFADRKRRVLFLQDLVEINKTPSPGGFLPPYRRKQFEITFQYLAGPSYREYHRYVVEPSGIKSVPNSSAAEIDGWRVVEYRLLGWDFHWGDNLGHGSGVRLP